MVKFRYQWFYTIFIVSLPNTKETPVKIVKFEFLFDINGYYQKLVSKIGIKVSWRYTL